jgi:putative ABC transport system permease protein
VQAGSGVRAVRTAVRGGLAGRRVQARAIGLVMLATAAASTLATGLVVDSNAPFDHAFAAQHGADITVTVAARTGDGRKVPARDLAATARLAGVTAAAGPFAGAAVTATAALPGGPGETRLPPLTLAGRSSPGGPVDDIVLSSGHWPTAIGQVVVSASQAGAGPGPRLRLGQVITLAGVPGSPALTVVGVGISATGTAGGWVLPAEMTALRVPLTEQMLYRFTSAGSGAAINADIAAVRRALPAGSVASAESWLTVKTREAQLAGPLVPFLVTFGLIGLVMSVLLVVNVVSGAVVAGTRRIGVLKSVGFTPVQVVAVYVLQVAVPAAAGVAGGAVIANVLAGSVLGRSSQVLAVAPQSIPLWVDLAVPLAMLGLAGIAALVPASRAGRLSAVQAIVTGRAPRPRHGRGAHRLLGRVRMLPRPVSIGLAGSFARPGRTFVTFAAILVGAVAVTFGAGLGSSLNRVAADTSLPDDQVIVGLPGLPGQAPAPLPGQAPAPLPSVAAQENAAAAAIRAQPGTMHYVTESDDELAVVGLAGAAAVTAFGGDASWIGYTLITGHWYGNGGAVVNTAFLNATGKHVGDTFTITGDGRSATLTITGEVFVFSNPGSSGVVLTNLSPVAALDPSGLSPQQYDVSLRPGVNAPGYANAVAAKLGQDYSAGTLGGGGLLNPISALIAIFTLLLAAVAGLGVLNTVLLMTRERVHDLGVFKAVGMTPGQTIAMVATTVAATGLIAGLIAVPAGTALQRAILPIMANGAQTALPAAVYNVYNPVELVLLALAGLVIAVAGSLAPASWAARTPAALALRAE